MKLKQKDLDLAKRQIEMGVMKGRVAKNLGVSGATISRMVTSDFDLTKFYSHHATKPTTFAKGFKYTEIGGLLADISRGIARLVEIEEQKLLREK